MNHHRTDLPEPSPRFCAPLPRALRDDAQTMSWSAFAARYSPAGGPLQLGTWTCDDAHRPATRLGAQPRSFRATLALGDRVETVTAAASGPVAALTAMLYDRGICLEMTGFHQLRSGEHTATFVQGGDGRRHEWAMGWAQDATESALRAVIACANLLLSAPA
ncbi:homocitrate synthase [Candidatus Mycolicibacterium alkanivorans]|uniref:Homocitrate synthase n=1 Tax=Candidatus Mycolicibacterium alkanivorans TaxID=2954114 RepID=A0ABS9YZM6_9MYCO|nr:homocitrate synthase [Candidatus Mycolicibacterium alkanivorans]MCI4676665.1 homocitrate synthase [Candidatus Mycolicibacterium alkanivorans]